jgi:hypothetical protein
MKRGLFQKSKHRVIPAQAGISCQSLIINNQQLSINDLQGIAGQARNEGTFETASCIILIFLADFLHIIALQRVNIV